MVLRITEQLKWSIIYLTRNVCLNIPGNTVNTQTNSLQDLMNGPVKQTLNLPVKNGETSSTVFRLLQEDFMKPVVDKGTLQGNIPCSRRWNSRNHFD